MAALTTLNAILSLSEDIRASVCKEQCKYLAYEIASLYVGQLVEKATSIPMTTCVAASVVVCKARLRGPESTS